MRTPTAWKQSLILTIETLLVACSCPAYQDPEPGPYPRGRLALELASGTYSHKTAGDPSRHDRQGAVMGGMAIEVLDRRLGAGLRLEGLSVDDDLFAASGGQETDVLDGELFLHLTHFAEQGPLQLRTRAGWMSGDMHLRDSAGRDLGFGTDGARVEFEPDLAIYQDRQLRWSAVGVAGCGFGWTAIDIEPGFRADSSMVTYKLGVGTRLRIDDVEVAAGWVHHWSSYEDAMAYDGPAVAGFDAEFSGIYVTFAARF